MKNLVVLIIISYLCSGLSAMAEEKQQKPTVKVSSSQYSVDVTIKDIPKGQQTLFIPIQIDTMILDLDKVALEGLSTQNILAVASSSKDKAGPGVGLIKFDEEGLPSTLSLKVLLKPVGEGQTTVSLLMVTDEPALPSKGLLINDQVKVNFSTGNEVEITEKLAGTKKKLVINQNKLTLHVQRAAQKEETLFIPVVYDKSLVDLDETFGHAIVAPGIAAKSFSSASLQEGGPGVEVLLTEVADKDFDIDIDLLPRKVGKTKLSLALPQKGHTAIVSGPIVDINPATISVVNK